MAALRLAVAIVLAISATARADTRVHSYAYVTGVKADYESAADEGVKQNRCDVAAQLPLAILKQRPKNDDRSPLAGATLVGERVSDPEKHCDDYLHTWQPVDFDPAHRDSVHFTWPHGGVDLGHAIISVIVLGMVGYLILEPLRYRWRIRRRPNRRYRD